jgi:acyl-CoA thioester hydrolase
MNPGRRKKGGYFSAEAGAPSAVIVRLKQRIRFSDVDPMGILWHGRYAQLFEQANEEIGRQCAMTYADFHHECLMAPIVQFHVDYFMPILLGEEVGIIGRMIWDDGARLNIEYEIRKENGELAATGYTVQMFVDEAGTPLVASPALQEKCRKRWQGGEFGGLR